MSQIFLLQLKQEEGYNVPKRLSHSAIVDGGGRKKKLPHNSISQLLRLEFKFKNNKVSKALKSQRSLSVANPMEVNIIL